MCQRDSGAEIANEDGLSRLIEAPRMVEDSGKWHWDEIFIFERKYGRTESVVWRRIVPEESGVHILGLERQARARERGKTLMTYLGFISAVAGLIREAKTMRGFGFQVFRVADEGAWHAHIKLVEGEDMKITKSDLWDARAEMERLFGPLAACPS